MSSRLENGDSSGLEPPLRLDSIVLDSIKCIFSDIQDRHNEGSPGLWTWNHSNKTVTWFDWGPEQPNNLNGQNCLAMLEYHNPLIPVWRDYFWNDVDCASSAHYMCEHKCFDQAGNRSP